MRQLSTPCSGCCCQVVAVAVADHDHDHDHVNNNHEIDETGFMLQPVVRRTWAPRGDTPIHRRSERHDRLTTIGALTVSPKQRRLGLYFRLDEQNATTDSVTRFVATLRRQLRRALWIIWDRLNVHRSAVRKLSDHYGTDIVFDFLPGYAPQLNPVERVWSHTKYGQLANYLPQDLRELGERVTECLSAKKNNHDLLHAFFRHAGLLLPR
jgi:transposase